MVIFHKKNRLLQNINNIGYIHTYISVSKNNPANLPEGKHEKAKEKEAKNFFQEYICFCL